MKKLGKKNSVSSETVEAFYCFCIVCACSCYCPWGVSEYRGEQSPKSSRDSSRRSSQTR